MSHRKQDRCTRCRFEIAERSPCLYDRAFRLASIELLDGAVLRPDAELSKDQLKQVAFVTLVETEEIADADA